jgi:hypothetical protein
LQAEDEAKVRAEVRGLAMRAAEAPRRTERETGRDESMALVRSGVTVCKPFEMAEDVWTSTFSQAPASCTTAPLPEMQRLAQDWPLGAHSGRKIGVMSVAYCHVVWLTPPLVDSTTVTTTQCRHWLLTTPNLSSSSPQQTTTSRKQLSQCRSSQVHSQAAPERLVCAVLPELTGAEKANPSGSNGVPHWLRTHRLVPVAQVLIGTPS